MVEWISTHQAGCGLMGEQGAESIHAKFNSLINTHLFGDTKSDSKAEKHNE